MLVIPGSVIGCSVFTPAMAAVFSCWARRSARCCVFRFVIPACSIFIPPGTSPWLMSMRAVVSSRDVEAAVLRVEVLADLLNARLLVVVPPALREHVDEGTDAAADGSPAERADEGTQHAEKIRRASAHERPESRAGREDRLREIGLREIGLRENILLGQRGTPSTYA
jgi:hypothetical protein